MERQDRLLKQGLYDPWFEHAGCGVGVVADIKGGWSHRIVRQSLEVLVNLGHRGAQSADPKTGDGAGILLQMPHRFFQRECGKLGIDLPQPGRYGVGTLLEGFSRRVSSGRVHAVSRWASPSSSARSSSAIWCRKWGRARPLYQRHTV